MREVPKQHKRHVEQVIYQKNYNKEIIWEGILPDLPIWRLYVEKLLNASFVDNHIRNIFVLVLTSDIQGQPIVEIFYVSVTTFHEQFFDNSTVAAHDGQVERSHAVGEILLV